MKDYKFHGSGGNVVTVQDDELVFSPRVADRTFRKVHWPKDEVAAIAIDNISKVNVGAAATFGVLAAGQGSATLP